MGESVNIVKTNRSCIIFW